MMRYLLPTFVIFVLCSPAYAAGDAPNPMELRWDTALWSVVVFVGLLVILRAKAWGPILEGLQKREDTIRQSLEDAKSTRLEMERMRSDFQRDLATAHQEIPKLMEDARKKAEALSAEREAREAAKLAEDRARMRRELEIAKDQALKEIWEQSAQLATLISAKVIGRSLSPDDHHRLMDEALQEMRQTTHN